MTASDAFLHDKSEPAALTSDAGTSDSEVVYDDAGTSTLDSATLPPLSGTDTASGDASSSDTTSPAAATAGSAAATSGCHADPGVMNSAARKAGNSDLLDQFAADYPKGPHDKPQSMCPAFGSLRVGLRMKRTASVLCGSACCVYGLTFTSHFYGARRTVGYVPFDSETLVTGKLFEDLRDAVHELADPERYDAVVVTNLCVPSASGVPLRLLPKVINGVRIVGIDVPGFGVPTHAEAKDVLAGAMLKFAREEAEQGPVARPASKPAASAGPSAGTNAPDQANGARPSITLLGEMFPADPVTISHLLAPLGLQAGPVVPTREWRELYAALDCAGVAAIHPFYAASVREFEAAGRPIVGSAPVGAEGTAQWLQAVGAMAGVPQATIAAAIDASLPAIKAALAANPINARITMSGYEGSELLVARLLIEAGADVRYVGTACAASPWSADDQAFLEARGVQVQFRASLEQDVAAFEAFDPDLVIGTTPVVQKAKQKATPALYFTNLISARPLMGVPGAAALAQIINGAIGSAARAERMHAFFADVGAGPNAGIWEDVPQDEPGFAKTYAARLKKQQANEGAVGC